LFLVRLEVLEVVLLVVCEDVLGRRFLVCGEVALAEGCVSVWFADVAVVVVVVFAVVAGLEVAGESGLLFVIEARIVLRFAFWAGRLFRRAVLQKLQELLRVCMNGCVTSAGCSFRSGLEPRAGCLSAAGAVFEFLNGGLYQRGLRARQSANKSLLVAEQAFEVLSRRRVLHRLIR